MRIVLLSWMIYSRRHHDLYTLPLRERGVRVDFYDCTPYFRPEGFRKIKLPESIDYDGVRLLHTREEIERALAELPEDAVVISLIPLENETLFLFRALRRAGARFGATMSKWRPNPYCDSLSGRNLDTPMKRLRTRYTSAKKLMRTLCRSPRVPSEWLGLPSADFIITNSRTEWESRYPIGPRTRYIRAHSTDYEIYRAWRESHRPPAPEAPRQRPLGVFLESASPVCADRMLTGKAGSGLTSEVYFPEVRAFLRRMEAECGVDLLVAAHPKAVYEGRLEHFQDWEIVQGATVDAVSRGDFVVVHTSNSVSFAVIMGKPVVFVTTDQLEEGKVGPYVHTHAEWLGKRVYNISRGEFPDLASELVVDRDQYQRYIDEFIKYDSEDRPYWDLVLDGLYDLYPELAPAGRRGAA